MESGSDEIKRENFGITDTHTSTPTDENSLNIEILKKVQYSSSQVTSCLNRLLYKCSNLYLIFLPIGWKSSASMIEAICVDRFGEGSYEKVVQEKELPFTTNLYNNILNQFPDIMSSFGFSMSAAEKQGKIYGYFVSTLKKVN